MLRISIHALLAESDSKQGRHYIGCKIFLFMIFLSTLSLRRATQPSKTHKLDKPFLSTLSLRRATHPIGILVTVIEISIHALLAESDQTKAFKVAALRISIHALLAESDQFKYVVQCRKVIFLSTLSLRRATIDTSKDVIKTTNFYPRSPCGERQFKLWRA